MSSFKQPQAQGEMIAIQLAKGDADRLREAARKHGTTVREYAASAVVEKLSREFARLSILGPEVDLEGSSIDESEFETEEERELARQAHEALVNTQRKRAQT